MSSTSGASAADKSWTSSVRSASGGTAGEELTDEKHECGYKSFLGCCGKF